MYKIVVWSDVACKDVTRDLGPVNSKRATISVGRGTYITFRRCVQYNSLR